MAEPWHQNMNTINVMHKKSHQFVFINPYTLVLKSTVGISTLYMILQGQKTNLPSDIHALRIFVVFWLESPIAS